MRRLHAEPETILSLATLLEDLELPPVYLGIDRLMITSRDGSKFLVIRQSGSPGAFFSNEYYRDGRHIRTTESHNLSALRTVIVAFAAFR